MPTSPARPARRLAAPTVALAIAGAALAGGAGACDAGPRADEPTRGPAVRVLGVNVGPNRPLPEDGAIEIAFDRHLSPLSVTRQAVAVVDKAGEAAKTPIVTYDPVARTLRLSNPNPDGSRWIREGEAYDLVFLRPETDDDDTFGVRAIDRAPLADDAPRVVGFRVGPPTGTPAREAHVHFCADVLPVFATKCAGATCHGPGEDAAASLVLTTSEGVAKTALGRVAQAANTGARAGTPSSAGRTFGVQMPLVEPGSPGTSFLLYKLLLAPAPAVDAGPPPALACRAPGGGAWPAASRDHRPLVDHEAYPSERERLALADAVLGREMPYPIPGASGYASSPLTFAERERVRLWIAQGADVPECGRCGAAD